MKQIFFFCMAITAIAGCKPEGLKQYIANDARKASAFAGVWTGASAIMTDNDAARKNFPNQTLDITQLAAFNKLQLKLDVSGDAPSNFTVSAIDPAAANVFGFTSGKWEVDDVTKVSQIRLINGTDTARLGVYVLSDLIGNKLSLTRVKSLDGTPMVTYNFDFTR